MSTNVSTTNGNYGWKPRQVITLTCPSGQTVQVRRPGPEITLKTGRIMRSWARKANLNPEEVQTALSKDLADMTDEELATAMLASREMVCGMLVSPKLVPNPRPGTDDIGPEDVDLSDYWYLWGYATENFMGIKIPVGESEVEVTDLETFRAGAGVSGDSVDSSHLSQDTERPDGDQGLVDSTTN